jgi:hypothetical protein
MDRLHYVYAVLYDDGCAELSGLPCYIGMGLGGRKDWHAMRVKAGRHPPYNKVFYEFLSDRLSKGFGIESVILKGGLTRSEAAALEIELIETHGRVDLGTGYLFNACGGGFGSRNPRQACARK